jgi:hypothetical protein
MDLCGYLPRLYMPQYCCSEAEKKNKDLGCQPKKFEFGRAKKLRMGLLGEEEK